MAEKTGARVTRLLSIVSFLERNGATSLEDLASHFGVTTATITSDVMMLWLTGMPGGMPDDLIDFDGFLFDDGIAAITQTQGVTQVRLTAREATALLGALAAMTATGAAPDAVVSAMAKLTAAVGADLPVSVSDSATVAPEVTTALSDAVARRRLSQVVYVDANDRRTVRDIDAHRIVAIDGQAYVECYCYRAEGYRTLRLDRITSVDVSEHPIEAPPRDGESFSLEPLFTAEVTIDRSRRWVVDDLPEATVTAAGDMVHATFPVADLTWAASTVLGAGSALRAAAPPVLVDEIKRQAADISAAHRP